MSRTAESQGGRSVQSVLHTTLWLLGDVQLRCFGPLDTIPAIASMTLSYVLKFYNLINRNKDILAG